MHSFLGTSFSLDWQSSSKTPTSSNANSIWIASKSSRVFLKGCGCQNTTWYFAKAITSLMKSGSGTFPQQQCCTEGHVRTLTPGTAEEGFLITDTRIGKYIVARKHWAGRWKLVTSNFYNSTPEKQVFSNYKVSTVGIKVIFNKVCPASIKYIITSITWERFTVSF